MRQKHKLLATGLAAGILSASMAITASAAQITEDSAKAIAFSNVGITADSVLYITTELQYDDGKQMYDIDLLTKDYMDYGFAINAENGAVLSIDYEWKAAPAPVVGAQPVVTMEQAKTLAAVHAGRTVDTVSFKKAETEPDDGRILHKLEFYTADGKEYEYKIDAVTGAILKWEYDAKHYVPQADIAKPAPSTPQAPSSAITGIESAKAAALKMAGLSSANVKWDKVKQDYEDGRLVYEGEFHCNHMEYEFEIDAATGVFLDWDVDEDD